MTFDAFFPTLELFAFSFLLLLIGYSIGAIPTGLWLTKWVGLGDVRRIGSGNIGAANVLRAGHRGIALLTLLLDALKGYLPTLLVLLLFQNLEQAAIIGLGTLIGHCFSFYLRFWGGKGVATGLGVLLALDWVMALAALVSWIVLVFFTQRSSVGSLAAVAVAVIVATITEATQLWLWVLVMALVIVYRHQANIRRLWLGQEPQISFLRRQPASIKPAHKDSNHAG